MSSAQSTLGFSEKRKHTRQPKVSSKYAVMGQEAYEQWKRSEACSLHAGMNLSIFWSSTRPQLTHLLKHKLHEQCKTDNAIMDEMGEPAVVAVKRSVARSLGPRGLEPSGDASLDNHTLSKIVTHTLSRLSTGIT